MDIINLMDTVSLTLTEARAAMTRGEITPQALTEACLEQIERLNPKINAFITVLNVIASGAFSAAKQSPNFSSHPLSGLPLALKDLYETAGVRTTAGTKFFNENVPAEDAVTVKKLKEAGVVILGKTNLHEIALGVTNINATTGNCLNPWDRTRITGGSSGGSAAAVVTGMALAALGTDTGGSIRIPASLCGVVGLKPTYGRISLRGIVPLSWNLDHAGPLTKSARDAALLLQVLAGYDREDPASPDVPVHNYLIDIDLGVKGWRIGLASGEYIEAAEPKVLEAVRSAAQVFKSLGARVEEVQLPWLRSAARANGLMTPADAAAFHRERLMEHPDWFGEDVRQRLQAGAAASSTEYILARREQSESRGKAAQFFGQYDLLLLPTTAISAPLIEGLDSLGQAPQLTRFTAPFNLTGLPALSIPCGLSPEGLPLGLQIVGPHWGEAAILRAANAYEKVRGEMRWRG